MIYLKRFLRILRFTILIVLALAVGATAVLTLTTKGRQNLAGLISDAVSAPGREVSISGLGGIWSGALTVDRVVIADGDGPWLAVRGVAVDWSPLALLGAKFRAERLFAERIELARLPKAEPGTPKTGGGGFSLPVAVELNDIDLPDIALGAELAGGVAAVSAKGTLRAEGSPIEIETDLKLARTDGRAGNVDASIQFVPGDNRLDVDIRGSEPSGGIIANLLKLPGEPAVDIVATGSGPAADWRGEGTFAVDGTVVTRVKGRHQFTDRGSDIEAQGDGEFARFMPQSLRPLLAGRTVFDVAGTALSSGGVDIQNGTVESDTLSGKVSGVVDPAGASDFALEFTAKGVGVPLSFGTEESPIDMIVQSASVRALGDGNAPDLDVGAVLNKVSTKTATVDGMNLLLHSDGFNIRSRTGPVTGNLTAKALILDNPTIAPLIAGEIRAELSGTLSEDKLTVDKGVIRSDGLDGGFGGDVSLIDGSIRLDLKGNVESAALPAALRPVLDSHVAISGTITRDTEGHVSADPFSLSSGALSASGRIQSAGDQIDAAVTGKLGDVSLLAKDATGAVDFALTAKGALAAPDVALTVTSDRIVAAQREIANLKLVASGKADLDYPAADVALTGSVGGETLDGKAKLSTAGGTREIKGLTLSLGKNRIAGDLVLDDKFLPLGTVNFELPDVGALAALALETAEGDLSGTVRFSTADGKPQIALDARTAAISRGDISARDVTVTATVADYLTAPTIAGKVRATSLTSGKTAVSGIDVTLNRDGVWTGFDGGATVADIPVRAKGRVQLAGGRTIIELAGGQASVRGLNVGIARPSTVQVVDGKAILDKLALSLGGGTATVSGTAGATLDLSAALANVPASVANSFAPGLDAAGTVSGTVKVTGAAANPAVSYDVDWKGAQTAQTRAVGFGAIAVASTGNFSGGKLSFTANVGDGSGLGLKGGGSVDTAGSRALSVDLSGKVPFGFLSERLAAQGTSLSGAADVTLSVSGTTSSPVIGGSVRASGARFVYAALGMAVNDLNVDIGLGNGVATLRTFTGTLSTGGRISGSGTIGIEPDGGFPADLVLKITDGRYTDGRVVTATMNGDLAVKGSLLTAPVLSGTVNLGRTVITVPEKLPTSLAELDVQHKNAPAAVRAQDAALRPASEATGGTGALTLDVTVNANNQIFVQGRGLDAELGGSLHLTGSSASPEAAGQFTLRRGRLSILGKRLEFKSGTITFSGSLVPYLDLSAESRAGDVTVVVTVKGPANNPKFDFSSVPALPDDEVLARLIFGRSMSNLSPLQIAQLAEAAAQFAGVGGSTSLLEKLRSNLGVDDLDVKTDETGGTSVSAGKYLNDRTYVTIEKGDRAGSGKATIDLNVGRGVKLRGEATDGGQAKGGIFFEKEY